MSVKKTDNELSIVHTANKSDIGKLNKQFTETKLAMERLNHKVDEILADNISAQELEELIDEVNGPSNDVNTIDTFRNKCQGIKTPFFPDWESLVQASKLKLESQGIDPDQISSYDLLSPEENYAIQQSLNRPLYERLPWDKWDYIFAFGTGVIAGVIDIFLGTPHYGLQKQMEDPNSWIGSYMEKVHKLHPDGAPPDYLGKHFGGAYHRGRSTGHDLLRPIEGIRQFMDGEFRGFYWVNGEKHFVESLVNQQGNLYQPKDLCAGVLGWMVHNFCDFFSATSLAIPGTSYLYGVDSREVRIFVEKDLYQNGINLRHLVLETIAPLSIEIIIRSYIFFRYRAGKVNQDALEQKKYELLTVGHAISAGINVGKVIIMEDPLLMNIPQIMALSKNLIRLVLKEYGRNSLTNKALRNLRDLRKAQQEYGELLNGGLPEIIVL